MKFGEMSVGNKVFILHSDNTLETEVIDNITKNGNKSFFGFQTSKLVVEVDNARSIYFDEDVDVVVFSEKHNLISGIVESS